MSDEKILIETKHLYKRFGLKKQKQVTAVNDVSLQIYKGETLGLVGESGCGKSTLGRVILGLIEASGGSVEYDGSNLSELSKRELRNLRKKMQIVFQDPYSSLNPKMNVFQLVREPLDAFKIGTVQERNERVARMFEIIGLTEEKFYRYPHEFSGGQRQRIMIARALILSPEFVVCDEPVSALDVSVRASVLNLLRHLQKEMGLTLLFISHDLSVVKHISNRVAVMYLGGIVELAGKDELYGHPLHPYTKALLSAIPIPDPDVGLDPHILPDDLPSPYHPPSGCRFHTRCEHCREQCIKECPQLKHIGNGHFVACHFYHEIEFDEEGACKL